MAWYEVLALLLGMLVFFMMLGIPVAFAFFASNLIGAYFFMGGEPGLLQLTRNAVDSLQNFALIPIPLFIYMGEILFHSGVATRAIDAIDRLIAGVPGRLSLVAVAGGTLFSSLTGSTIANTALLSSTLLPDMYRRGYHASVSIGPIVAVGALAMLIPPSALAVLLGSIARVPIAELLVASIVPAVLLAVFFFAYIIVRTTLQPSLAPAYAVERLSWRERVAPFIRYVLPLSAIFAVVVGSIVAGIATPTESAGLGALAATAIPALYRRLTWESFRVSVRQTLRVSVMILFIIAGSATFSQILAFSQATDGLTELVASSGFTPTLLVLGMLAVLLFLGCFMDQISMMMIAVPIFMPIAVANGFDVVWFAVLLLIILEVSLATPPFGLLLFVAKGAAPRETAMGEIIRSVFPFVLITLFLEGLLIAFPGIVLMLPGLISR